MSAKTRSKPINLMDYLPPSDAVRNRIRELKEEIRKLEVLLRTALEVENSGPPNSLTTEGFENVHQ